MDANKNNAILRFAFISVHSRLKKQNPTDEPLLLVGRNDSSRLAMPLPFVSLSKIRETDRDRLLTSGRSLVRLLNIMENTECRCILVKP